MNSRSQIVKSITVITIVWDARLLANASSLEMWRRFRAESFQPHTIAINISIEINTIFDLLIFQRIYRPKLVELINNDVSI